MHVLCKCQSRRFKHLFTKRRRYPRIDLSTVDDGYKVHDLRTSYIGKNWNRKHLFSVLFKQMMFRALFCGGIILWEDNAICVPVLPNILFEDIKDLSAWFCLPWLIPSNLSSMWTLAGQAANLINLNNLIVIWRKIDNGLTNFHKFLVFSIDKISNLFLF